MYPIKLDQGHRQLNMCPIKLDQGHGPLDMRLIKLDQGHRPLDMRLINLDLCSFFYTLNIKSKYFLNNSPTSPRIGIVAAMP